MTTRFLSLVAWLSIPCALAVAADRERVSVGDGSPTAQQVEQFLFPEAECEDAKYHCLAVRPSTERSIGIDVKFHTGSAELTPEARRQLEGVGKALSSRTGKLKPGEIIVEGHTDVRGADDFNQQLSERRAQTVTRHLVSVYGVDAKVLRPVGKGKNELIDKTRPDSEVNRRVELVRKAE